MSILNVYPFLKQKWPRLIKTKLDNFKNRKKTDPLLIFDILKFEISSLVNLIFSLFQT